jgi:hypothetical protein
MGQQHLRDHSKLDTEQLRQATTLTSNDGDICHLTDRPNKQPAKGSGGVKASPAAKQAVIGPTPEKMRRHPVTTESAHEENRQELTRTLVSILPEKSHMRRKKSSNEEKHDLLLNASNQQLWTQVMA